MPYVRGCGGEQVFDKITTVRFEERRGREARTCYRAPPIWILIHWAWGGGADPEIDRISTGWFWGGEKISEGRISSQNGVDFLCGGGDREQTEHSGEVYVIWTVNHKVFQIEMWREYRRSIHLRWRREAITWHALNLDFDLDEGERRKTEHAL